MISWMQKHKKWLVITIWISTIAFVGAGMVGWGQFSFGSGDKVAKVGDIDITHANYNRRYNQVYNELAQMLNGNIDQEIAKKEGVDKIALNQLIQQALLENLALDFGIRVSDDEVAQAILQDEAFMNNGQFDKELYKRVLAENNLRPQEYEENIKKAVLTDRLLSFMPFGNITELEANAFVSILNIANDIEYKIITSENLNIKLKEEEIKQHYEQNKNKWLESIQYKIEYIVTNAKDVTPNDVQMREFYEAHKSNYIGLDGNLLPYENIQARVMKDTQADLAQIQAKRDYVKLRDNVSEKLPTKSIKEGEAAFSEQADINIYQALKLANAKDTIQPIALNSEGDFVSIKIIEKSTPMPKSYEQAKKDVIDELKNIKTNSTLASAANDMVKNFQGEKANKITRFYLGELASLSLDDKRLVLQEMFASDKKSGFVILGDKAFLYKILEQNLLDTTQHNMQVTIPMIRSIKSDVIGGVLMEYLNKKYKTSIFIDI